MTKQREWIEIGKMYSALCEDFERVEIIKNDNGYVVILDDCYYSDTLESLYLAIKEQYFSNVLEIEEYEDFEVDVDSETMDAIQNLADENYETVDETITNILVDYIQREKQEQEKCCCTDGSCRI